MISDPFTISSIGCRWPDNRCDENVDMRLLRNDIKLCQKHALLVWSVIEEQIQESQMTPEQLREHQEQQQSMHAEAVEAAKAAEAAERRKTKREGYVYYLRVGQHIKIGFASNLESRLRSYPPDTALLAVERGTIDLETSRHREFAATRSDGREWYWPKPWLMEHIARVAENGQHTWWAESEWRRKDTRPKATPSPKYWR